ncbi:MAG: lytic transglycosylase domain-containing protein [Pseudomonadota bacterium]
MVSAKTGVRLLLAAGLLAGPLAYAGDEIYMYKKGNGVRVYTDRIPRHTAYVRIENTGRPTASASCMGLTPSKLETRASSFQTLINKYAARHDVKPALVRAVMRVESCFDPRAVSRSGARGLMQLMPQTAAHLGVRDSFDANENVDGGVRYLKMMLERFNQNTKLALAAYNAGPTAVTDHKGIPPFPETQTYVKRVLADYQKNVSRELADAKTLPPA